MATLLALVVLLAPAPQPVVADNTPPVVFSQVEAVVQQRCVMCHNAQLQNKNVALHTPELIRQHALQMYQQVVVLRQMPFNNATQITEAERQIVRRWHEAGAPGP